MASTKSGTPANSRAKDATQLLMADHKKVSKIFADYEKAADGDTARKQELAKMACDELTVHAQVEEELLYPALYEAFKDSDDALVDEAEVEHGTIKQLVATLQESDPSDRLFDANMTVLAEYVKHHVKEEESEIFPKARKAKSLDLKRMGQEIAARKAQLQEELGIESDEQPAGRRPAPAQRHA
ncbi:MAG TPA: hemerythrin domain-containing protein [Burkholderiales bacterium]|nr:hemerythrin domain-containing protein [Burkholderiales bacterium]